MQFQLLQQGEWRMGDGEERKGRCALPGNSPLLGFTATFRGQPHGKVELVVVFLPDQFGQIGELCIKL